MSMPAGQFKATCLKVMDRVRRTREPVVITKRGKPVARLDPIEEDAPVTLFGYLAPTGETWDADK